MPPLTPLKNPGGGVSVCILVAIRNIRPWNYTCTCIYVYSQERMRAEGAKEHATCVRM